MTLAEAIARVHDGAGDALVVHANGMISRAGFGHEDRPEHFYMIGSMGLAASIGLGLALVRPARRVVVCDGDGNVLMNLGALAQVAARRPANLLHVCFDNGVHGSTGNQATIARQIALDEVARAAGYAAVRRVDEPAALARALAELGARPGPAFLLVRITPALPDPPFPRVTVEPPDMTVRFRAAAACAARP
jgi:thiamine pyrophosphate-dependent acetolactate synthase large subunit-like protein